jgi:hypothetical protein
MAFSSIQFKTPIQKAAQKCIVYNTSNGLDIIHITFLIFFFKEDKTAPIIATKE